MKKKEIKKTKIKSKNKVSSKQFMEFLNGINCRLDWMIKYMEVWLIESDIRKLKDKLTDKIDLKELSQLEKRVNVIEKKLQNRRSSIFSH